MKSRIFAICLAITAMVGANVYSQECATCSDASPCMTCATCKPCELFGGLKNLMSCRPCTECVVSTSVAPACAPIAPACAPIAPACAPIEASCAPIQDCYAPACQPRFRRLVDLFPRHNCGGCDSCVAPAPSCDVAPTCDTCAPCARPIFGFSLKRNRMASCDVAPACDIAPTCNTCEAAPVCTTGCAAPCLKPILVNAVRVPIIGIRDAFNGLFTTLADATAPRCACSCGLPSCGVCGDVAPACGPISYEQSCGTVAVPAPATTSTAAPLPASPNKAKAVQTK